MALLNRAVSRRHITWTLKDATGTPIVATAQFEVGDLSVTGFTEGNAPLTPVHDRGVIYDGIRADDELSSISGSVHANQITDSTEKLIVDALCKTGAFSSGVSTRGANAEWFVECEITIERTDAGHSTDETFTAGYCRGTCGWSEADPAVWQFTIEAWPFDGAAAITRAGA